MSSVIRIPSGLPRRCAAAVAGIALFIGAIGIGTATASPSTAPPARAGMGMAYDAARGEVVLFGGIDSSGTRFDDTWTWDGRSWTERHPATSPPARYAMGMTYDAAREEVVLFGGYSPYFGDTWTWDGTNWTKEHPAKSPPGRDYLSLAFDAARGDVVLFGGYRSGRLGDTWTWDGTTWTQQHPGASPSSRDSMGMAFDAAEGEVVLFGGHAGGNCCSQADTWTWDGVTWTQQHPATSPPGRGLMGMSYDTTLGSIVMFGGRSRKHDVDDTWTWDGATWTQQQPAVSPTARESMGLAYDVGRDRIVAFGGEDLARRSFGDTWTWNGSVWSIPFRARVHLSPASGPPGTEVATAGRGFAAFEDVTITFVDSVNGKTVLGTFSADASGALDAAVTIPADATAGAQRVSAVGSLSRQKAKATFTVT